MCDEAISDQEPVETFSMKLFIVKDPDSNELFNVGADLEGGVEGPEDFRQLVKASFYFLRLLGHSSLGQEGLDVFYQELKALLP